jgi:CheY-like chemotaxis protein
LEARLRSDEQVTLVAADAISGSALAMHQKPDLIIIDISLPGGNGLNLAEQFRHLPETRYHRQQGYSASRGSNAPSGVRVFGKTV